MQVPFSGDKSVDAKAVSADADLVSADACTVSADASAASADTGHLSDLKPGRSSRRDQNRDAAAPASSTTRAWSRRFKDCGRAEVARCPQELGNLDPDLSSSISNAAL
jgi:hypothetical protein